MTDSSTSIEPHTLDVREDLRNGKEPLPMIMQVLNTLSPGQPLRLLATFEPLPLYAVLGRKGYGHQATRHGEGDWEVLFTPGTASTPPAASAIPATDDDAWPTPATTLDNRGLGPPEPLVRILNALEHLPNGGVLEAINERDPVFLYPELETRGAQIRTEKRADGNVHILIRRAVKP